MTDSAPVGLAEIALRLGVRPQTARNWHHRGVLPPHRWVVSGSPAWPWDEIVEWAEATGRGVHDPSDERPSPR